MSDGVQRLGTAPAAPPRVRLAAWRSRQSVAARAVDATGARERTLSPVPLGLAIVVAGAPSLVFLATHLNNPVVGVACVALASAAILAVLRDLARMPLAPDIPILALCLLVGVALCLLGGEGHVFFANDDWLIRDAVLGDLVANPWPVGYEYAGDPTLMRAPLGLYLTPALVGKALGGKALGLRAAHWALLAQNSLLAGCVLYAFAGAAGRRGRAAWIVAVFVVFSGWDIAGQMLFGKPLAVGTHLSHWAGALQFTAAATQIFWAPNHALAGWLFVAAYLAWLRGTMAATSLLVVFGLCTFWSPLSAIGALPFAARAVLADLRARRVEGAGALALAAAALALAPVALYLGLDAGRVTHGTQLIDGTFLVLYGLFLTFELLPFAAIAVLLRPIRGPDRWRTDIGLAVAVLLVVPLFRIGGSDFVMRASIPALALLALCVADRAWPDDTAPAPGPMAAVLAVLAVGAVTPAYEVARAVTSPAFAVSACNLTTAGRFPPNTGPLFHYLARTDRLAGMFGLLRRPSILLSTDRAITDCWPGDTGFRG